MARRAIIMALVQAGIPRAQIARQLGISRQAVYQHIQAASLENPIAILDARRRIRGLRREVEKINRILAELEEAVG